MNNWLKYFTEPLRVGPLDSANAIGEAGGGCGDYVRIYLNISHGKVDDAAFLASGCPVAIAGAGACAELAAGRSFLEAAQISAPAIAELLEDAPRSRDSCLNLSALALARALENYERSNELGLKKTNFILVAMSGGVDSSVTAVKLSREAHRVIGVTLRLHNLNPGESTKCCSAADIRDAKKIADNADFPHIVLDMIKEFQEDVIDDFCQNYLSGRTPNPCVECNRNIRFTHLIKSARNLGAAQIATGHYVRIIRRGSKFEVARARDLSKDQSYMFWAATQEVLAKYLTPLGELTKDEVRDLAHSLDLHVASKPESQDVCFVPDNDYADFVSRSTGHKFSGGPIHDVDGQVIGRHKGLIRYTIGQRRGLNVAASDPLYVVSLDMKNNVLVAGGKDDLLETSFSISQLNIISGEPRTSGSFRSDVMTRYNGELIEATIHPQEGNKAIVDLKKPFGPIAPGQSAVFYDGDIVLGGGIID